MFLQIAPQFKFLSLVYLFVLLTNPLFAEKSSPIRKPSNLTFIENKGQWANWVKYRAPLTNGSFFVDNHSLTFLLHSPLSHHFHAAYPAPVDTVIKGQVIRLNFLGTNPAATFETAEKENHYRNYFYGNDPSHWVSKVYGAKELTIKNIYAQIDLVLFGSEENIEYQWLVHPGGNPSDIKIQYEGADNIRLEKQEILYECNQGKFRELAPFVYQNDKKEIGSKYIFNAEDKTVQLAINGYNHAADLIIDPTLIFVSYTGSTSDDWGFTATYDNDGNEYAGSLIFEFRSAYSSSSGLGHFPTVGAFQTSFQGSEEDIGISKFSANGSQLLFSSYIGGNGNERAHSLMVNPNDELYILGSSNSSNFPVTSGSFDNSANGDYDIVILKFSPTGASLLASTYLGGSGRDGRNGYCYENANPVIVQGNPIYFNYGDDVRGEIYIDSLSNVFVASSSSSTDFPTQSAFKNSNSGQQDAVVFKFNSNLSNLVFSTYLGGSGKDAAYGIKTDPSGNVFVSGGTESTNFNTTSGTLHPAYQGGIADGYVCKLSPTGNTLLAGTFLGTNDYDQTYFLEIDIQDRIYVVGQTLGNYPILNTNYHNQNGKQFIQVMNNDLSQSLHSTIFGANGQINISPTAFLVDRCFNVYVAGWGGNVNDFNSLGINFMPPRGNTFGLPTTANAIKTNTDGSDLYFIVFERDFNGLLYGSFYGGNGPVGEHVDGGTCRFDKEGIIYSAVCASCSDTSHLFPTTPGAYCTSNPSLNCNLAALKLEMHLAGTKITANANPKSTGCVPLTVNFITALTNVAQVEWHFGDGSAISTSHNPQHIYTDTGTFHVMVVGIDSSTCNMRDTAFLEVWVRNDSITGDFTPAINIDCRNKLFTATSHNYPSTAYSWNFGDGSTLAHTPIVAHTYSTPATYTISLTVSDTSKCNPLNSFSKQITIPKIINLAIAPSDTQGCIPLTINFGNNTANTSAGTFLWIFGDGDSSTLRNPTHTYTHGGHYVAHVYLTDSNSCNIKDSLTQHIFAIDSAADATFQTVRHFYGCDSVKVTVSSSYLGEDSESWNFGDGFTSTANPVTHTYHAPTFDTITHIIVDFDKICKPRDTAKIIISLTPLHTNISIPDTIGCVPFKAFMNGVTPLLTTHFYWFFSDGDSTSGQHVSHTFKPVGTYQVLCVSIDSNSCVNVDSTRGKIEVIDDSTKAHFGIQVLTDCDSNFNIHLINSSTNAVNYYWDFGNGDTSMQTNPNAHYTLPGTYTIKLLAVDTTRCHPRDSVYHTVHFKPNSIIHFDVNNVCLGQWAQFINQSNPAANYHWNFGDDSLSNIYSPSHLYLNDGTFTATLFMKDTSTCNIYDTLRKPVIVYLQPIASFILPADTVKFGVPVTFTNTSQHYNTSNWSFGDNTFSTDENPTHSYDHSVKWQRVCLEVYIANAPCRDTICDSLYVKFTKLVGVPNAFTPNGDGQNDVVFVEGKGIVELDFKIFNRWGQLVFQTTDQKQGWDGTFKGEKQEMEVYTWVANVKFINGDRDAIKGNITLLR